MENAWNEYQSFYTSQSESEFDLDYLIDQYITDLASQSLASSQHAEGITPTFFRTYWKEYYPSQEDFDDDELDDLLDKLDSLNVSDTSTTAISCPICSTNTLDLEDESYSCGRCKIRGSSQVIIILFGWVIWYPGFFRFLYSESYSSVMPLCFLC